MANAAIDLRWPYAYPSQRHSVVHEPPLERLQNEVLGWPVAHRENITAALQDVSDEVCRPFNLDHCRGLMSYVGLWPIVKVEECSCGWGRCH
eukprot:scaffold17111_cov36-Tisochrysis_lutea.AAC.2